MSRAVDRHLRQPIVVLISGAGSNLQAILETAERQQWSERLGAGVVAVISNRPEAPGLQLACAAGLQTQVLDHRSFSSREAFDEALMRAIDPYRPALVVLAGFMRILTPGFVRHYAGRMINIHPSLLPAFPGLNTHRRALQAGCKVAGATVHWVTADLDHGPILAQAVVPILPDDTEHTLAQRVLSQEHRIYPQQIGRVLERPS